MTERPAPTGPNATELVERLAQAINLFRNEPALRGLGELRKSPGFTALVDAWSEAHDFHLGGWAYHPDMRKRWGLQSMPEPLLDAWALGHVEH
ncbi:hypothetical protein AIGOOFII_3509 [Methylobacterium marchantiae]|nr:hypothetical protein AIGOOFII_3509 [Methylobacterium marchantiae]